MKEYVVMPKEDWEGVTNAIRTKKGENAKYFSSEASGAILSIPTNGGSGGTCNHLIVTLDNNGIITMSHGGGETGFTLYKIDTYGNVYTERDVNSDTNTSWDVSNHITETGWQYFAVCYIWKHLGENRELVLAECAMSNTITFGTSGGGNSGFDGSAYHYYFDDADEQWYDASGMDYDTMSSTGYCPNCGCTLSEMAMRGAFHTNCPVCKVAITYDEGSVALRG